MQALAWLPAVGIAMHEESSGALVLQQLRLWQKHGEIARLCIGF